MSQGVLRWLVDECIEARVVERLRRDGHDVSYVAEAVAGVTDLEVIELAAAEHRLLLTGDKDFGDLIFRGARAVPGLVLMRLPSEQHALREKRLVATVQAFGDRLYGHYTVVEEKRSRLRPLPAR